MSSFKRQQVSSHQPLQNDWPDSERRGWRATCSKTIRIGVTGGWMGTGRERNGSAYLRWHWGRDSGCATDCRSSSGVSRWCRRAAAATIRASGCLGGSAPTGPDRWRWPLPVPLCCSWWSATTGTSIKFNIGYHSFIHSIGWRWHGHSTVSWWFRADSIEMTGF